MLIIVLFGETLMFIIGRFLKGTPLKSLFGVSSSGNKSVFL
jgi:hypothetical protein